MEEKRIKEFINKLNTHSTRLSESFRPKLNEECIKLDLGMAHLMVLKLLSARKEPPIITVLAKQLSVSAPMMTNIIDRVESAGMVKRTRDLADRRIVKIEITPKGRAVVTRLDKEHMGRLLELLKKLNDSEQKQFMDALTVLMNLIEKSLV